MALFYVVMAVRMVVVVMAMMILRVAVVVVLLFVLFCSCRRQTDKWKVNREMSTKERSRTCLWRSLPPEREILCTHII